MGNLKNFTSKFWSSCDNTYFMCFQSSALFSPLVTIEFLFFSPKMQRKKSKASVAMMKVLPNELENQPEFDGFTEWLQTFELYRGKQGVEEFEDEGRVVGKFKVINFLSNLDTATTFY